MRYFVLNDYVIEIFSSIQGEGKYVGCRQAFVRFADCNLRCAYCDTDYRRHETCSVETHAGSMRFDTIPNPIALETLVATVKRLMSEVPTHSLSFTGGEPLLHTQFIKKAADRLDGVKIFLETNGTLPGELERVIDVVDILSVDIKMPRSIGGTDLFDAHREFLKIARRKEYFIKLIVDGEMTPEEFMAAVEFIAAEDRNALFILQPVTPVGIIRAARPEMILRYHMEAAKRLSDVRVIPQTHRLTSVF